MSETQKSVTEQHATSDDGLQANNSEQEVGVVVSHLEDSKTLEVPKTSAESLSNIVKIKQMQQEEKKNLNIGFTDQLKGIKAGPQRNKLEAAWKLAKEQLSIKHLLELDKHDNRPAEEPVEPVNTKPLPLKSATKDVEEDDEDTIRSFMDSCFVETEKGKKIYNLNITRQFNYIPNIPIVHPYNYPWALCPVAVRLPRSFLKHLPSHLQNSVNSIPSSHIDVFFLPQAKFVIEGLKLAKADSLSLKAWPWVFPELTSLDSVVSSPKEYRKTVFLGAFPVQDRKTEDFAILEENGLFRTMGKADKFIRMNDIRPYFLNLHDGKISPNNAQLDFTEEAKSSNVAMYSVCAIREEQRCAVTLHWLLMPEDFTKYKTAVEQQDPNTFTVKAFIALLRENFGTNRLLMDSLTQLLGPYSKVM